MRAQIPFTDRSRVPQRLQVALQVFEVLGLQPDLRRVRLDLLAEQLAMHAKEGAAATAQALQQDEGLGPQSRRELTMRMADLRCQQSRPHEALELLDRLHPPVNRDEKEWPYVQVIRANSLRLAERWAEAEAAFEELAHRSQLDVEANPDSLQPRAHLANALTYLGVIALKQHRVEEGLARFAEVEALFAERFILALPRLEFFSLAAGALWDAGRFADAERKLDAAIRVRDGLEQDMGDPWQREAFLVTWAWLDQKRAALSLRRGDAATAFEGFERSKSRVLRSIARSHAPRGTEVRALAAGLEAAYGRARAELAQHSAALEVTAQDDPGRDGLVESIRRLRQHADALRRLVETRHVEAAARVAFPASTQSVAEDADMILDLDRGARWALVSYIAADEGIGVVVRTPAHINGVWLDQPTYSDLRASVLDRWSVVRNRLRRGMASQADWDTALKEGISELSKYLMTPIEWLLESDAVERLAIVPHRSLHLVPFAALTDKRGKPLVDRFRGICVLPSVSLAADLLRRRPVPREGDITIFASPDSAAPLMGLEAALIEALWEKRGKTTTNLVGAQANPAALFKCAPESGIVHLACHGYWDSDEFHRSGLWLSSPPTDAVPIFGCSGGRVTLSAILGAMDLSYCSLTVLSACESGLALTSAADDPLGFPFLMALAGSRSVIASLWRIPDEATMLLMTNLHRRIAGGTPTAEALTQAQGWLRALPAQQAVVMLKEARALLQSLEDVPQVIRDQATAALDRGITRAQTSNEPPYAHPNHWAAFSCTGPPEAAVTTDARRGW
jgi:CHAT domain-containing protein